MKDVNKVEVEHLPRLTEFSQVSSPPHHATELSFEYSPPLPLSHEYTPHPLKKKFA